jgi:hypothetical protein
MNGLAQVPLRMSIYQFYSGVAQTIVHGVNGLVQWQLRVDISQ